MLANEAKRADVGSRIDLSGTGAGGIRRGTGCWVGVRFRCGVGVPAREGLPEEELEVSEVGDWALGVGFVGLGAVEGFTEGERGGPEWDLEGPASCGWDELCDEG